MRIPFGGFPYHYRCSQFFWNAFEPLFQNHYMISNLSWSHNLNETEAVKESIRLPSSDIIRHRLLKLDADEYPSLTLHAHPSGSGCPHLTIYGGPEGYAAWLSLADPTGACGAGLITYTDPHKRAANISGYRTIGRTYPGVEIDEVCFTTNVELILSIIDHFAVTGQWKPRVPFVFERDDEDGLSREYTMLLGEPTEYPEPD